MNWIKASIQTKTEGVEIVTGVLLSCGINGVQVIDPTDLQQILSVEPRQWDYVDDGLLDNSNDGRAFVEFYVTTDAAGLEMLSQVKSQLALLKLEASCFELGNLDLTIETKDDSTWLNEWKKHYKPFRIGKSVVIVPVWEEYDAKPGDIVLTIDPGSVFGTGLHQTTQLCIEAMEEYITTGCSMMDLGCGSGILSITGLLLGAGDVFACDFDPAAGIATKENAALNPVKQDMLTIVTGDIFDLEIDSSRKFNVITANIVADVIIRLSPSVYKYMKHNSIFIASGIIDERLDDVINSLKGNGLFIEKKLSRDGWNCVVSRYA
jgi:ribosomal protein L11 methyltransferase